MSLPLLLHWIFNEESSTTGGALICKPVAASAVVNSFWLEMGSTESGLWHASLKNTLLNVQVLPLMVTVTSLLLYPASANFEWKRIWRNGCLNMVGKEKWCNFFFLGKMSAFLLVNPEQCRSMQPKTVYKAGFAIGQKTELACRQ